VILILNDNIRYFQLTELSDFIKDEHGIEVTISALQHYIRDGHLDPELVQNKKLYSENNISKFLEWYSVPARQRRIILNKEAKVLAFANNKGGVGKTVSVHNVSAALTQLRHKVLMIDFDPQANLSMACDLEIQEEKTFTDLLMERCEIEEVVKKISHLLHVIPANPELSLFERKPRQYELKNEIINKIIQELKPEYDFIIFDAPPHMSLLTSSLVLETEHLFIPIKPEAFAYEGLVGFLEYINEENPNADISGIFLTQYDERTNLHRAYQEKIEAEYPDLFFQSLIRSNISLSESNTMKTDIFSYRRSSHGAKDYMGLTKTILDKLQR
jgi:chromosome partitioning protein